MFERREHSVTVARCAGGSRAAKSLFRESFLAIPFGMVLLILLELGGASAWAVTRYVDQLTGADTRDGLTRATAYQTIGKACQVVVPGDTVIVLPGVYHEHVQLLRSGTATQPITFMADQLGKNRVVVSGANPAVRAGQVSWRLENAALQLYSVPFTHTPGRMLYDDLDLLSYASLQDLSSFRISDLAEGKPAPGPRHGYFFDAAAQRLYVRLHSSGKYGSPNPAQHVMKIGPPGAAGRYGTEIEKRTDYLWAIASSQPAHVILDGFTFETPGFAAVWVHRGSATIRNCWFRGCRAAVSGWAFNDPARPTSDVTIEYCDISEAPTMADAEEVIAYVETLSAAERDSFPRFFWWHRKYPSLTSYQGGAFNDLGLRPRILQNFFHDMMDGVSGFAVDWSENCEVAYNRFERILDNAVEAENHAKNLRVHHNYAKDVFEPFSYQPLSGPPWPASVWFHHNVVFTTAAASALWRKPLLRWTPGSVKIKAQSGFTAPGLDGVAVFNNTILFESGDVFTLSSNTANSSNFHFHNNLVVAQRLDRTVPGTMLPNMNFARNLVAPAAPGEPGPGAVFAGTNGQLLTSRAAFGLVDAAGENFALAPGSPAIGAGAVLPQYPGSSADVGALAFGETWQPPNVGPQVALQPQLYQSWSEALFPFRPRDSGVTNPLADADFNGRINLLEYALGGSFSQLLPTQGSDGRLLLNFTRPDPAPLDLRYDLQVTSTPSGPWNTGSPHVETTDVEPDGDGFAEVTVRDNIPPPNSKTRFMRIGVSQITPAARPIVTYPPYTAPVDRTGAIISDDAFTDGNRSAGADPLDMDWWWLSPSSSGAPPTVSVTDDQAGLGGGLALRMDNAGTDTNPYSSKSIIATFPVQTLTAVGQQVVLTFDFRFTSIFASHPLNFFRLGLYHSQGTRVTQDNRSSEPNDDSGYTATLSFGDLPGRSIFTEEPGTTSPIFNEDLVQLGTDISNVFSLGVTSSKLRARFAVERTSTGVRLAVKIFDAAGAMLLEAYETDNVTPFTTFDEIVISTTRTEADYLIDNVRIQKVPAP